MKKLMYGTPFILLAFVLMTGCNSKTEKNAYHDPLDLSGRDTAISPAQDFFLYANGDWLKNTKIPASQTGWGSFYIVRDQALSNMKMILDSCEALKDPVKGSPAQQIGDLYAVALDSAAIDSAGISPLENDLKQITSIKNVSDLLAVITAGYKKGNGVLFGFYVSPDDKNSNIERPHFDQGGLGLPNKNYYFKTDSASKNIRDAYVNYITKILSLNGDNTAPRDASGILALETKLATASKTPVELRDPQANYHLLTAKEMDKTAPDINWQNLLQQFNVREDTLQVGQPEFYSALSGLLKSTPIAVWKNYLAFHLISSYAPWLSKPFADARFDFYNKLLNGQQEPEARWKRACSLVNGTLGDALGKLYVARYFPPSAKAYMENLVNNLQETYRQRIQQADWMSDSTKAKAIDKLNAFTKKIGYPDHWKDYSSIDIDRSSLIGDLQRIGQWQYNYDINKLGKPTDKSEWGMTPPTVNAYYDPSFNEIVFPAGILQPPFYFQHGDDAVNYGAIGAVIGHEMTHGFDDQGSQYDKDGNLKNWWTTEDRAKFNAHADQIVKQYDNYVVLDSVHVNGKLTEGENIADNGGLAIAYAAFQKTPEAHKDTVIDGYTPDQRFFLAWAQVWRVKDRPQRLLWRINNDPHSPEEYRVNGPVSNMTAFYQAFNIKPDDKMYRPDSMRVKIW
ncbi:MAG: M13 family peptidase [Chitinophagaceae bacterium]|nr:MAG: M13 family peptidase [Chitinophagaceae bacterium]